VTENGFDEIAYNQQIERDYRWNFTFNALDGAIFWFGASFLSGSTVLPVYAARLTDSRLVIGLLTAIGSSGWFLPQLFTANLVERLPRRKPFVAFLGLFAERFPFLPLALSALFVAAARPTLAVALLLFFFTWHCYGSGLLAAGWQDMIAKIIPLSSRGRFFGLSNFGGALLGVFGAQATTWILARYTFPNNFAYAMLIGFAALLLSWFFLIQTREPARPPAKERVSHREYWRKLPALLRSDRNFSRYLASRVLMALGRAAAIGLAAVYAVQRWHLPDQQAGVFTTLLLVSQTVFNLLFGYLGDRRGHKISLEWGLLAWASAMGVALLAPTPFWFYFIFVGFGAATAAEMTCGMTILPEFCGPDDRPTYIGLGNSTTGLFSVIAPLLGGWMAGALGYPALFALSLSLTLISWGMLRWWVREPRTANC
jgi:MFS family permease